ncbi:hypothetical protein [Halobaculum lipolyticum]|uniref:Uncharacterized protein n=1 Tax=Halobaculum lipolyticum TaxID=3032001 RepID=A0ABD5W8A3_9EURY|nr:hypothetical protein [Halobaculum sp. DT31]
MGVTHTPSTGDAAADPRRVLVRYLADELDPGETGFFRARNVRKATDLNGNDAGMMLARLAGRDGGMHTPPNPSPVFDLEEWSNDSRGRLWKVTRRPENGGDDS